MTRPMTRPMPRRLVLVAVAVALLASVGLAGCRGSSKSVSARLTVDGQAEVTRPGEDRREVTKTRDLKVSDRVRIRQGTAEIAFSGNRRLELRLGTDVELQGGGRPVLMGGDLLVTSPDAPFVVGFIGGEVAVTGVARMSRGVALLVATYQGKAALSAGGRSIDVGALRQAAVQPAGPSPTRVSPLEASPSDPWDQRFLSDAIDLGNQLAARSQGFSAQLGPTEGRSVAFFRTLFPRLAAEPALDGTLFNAARPPGETLVGAAITLEGRRGTFAERWAAVFGFHDEGAPWGLVALDQAVDRVPLLESIEGAIGRSPKTFAETAPGSGPSTLPGFGPSTTTTTVAPRSTTTTTRPRTGVTAPTTTTTAPATSTSIPSGPLNTGSPLIDDTVKSLVDTLTGLLRSLGM